jgi:RNAse (barnase) inhibitor barstar
MNSSEIDSLHILPLLHMPLETQSLRRARLVKNARLEGMIELFSDAGTGSGQLPPEKLNGFFDFSGKRAGDYEIICQLGELPSYDVYSLRISLRQIGIDIDSLEGLRLSNDRIDELTGYMAEFTRPLMRFVYGDTGVAPAGFVNLVNLLGSPGASAARVKIAEMAARLDVDVMRIPNFLEDYADVYMSLSFYGQCLEKITPQLDDVLATLRTIRETRSFAHNHALIHDCTQTEQKLHRLFSDVTGVLDDFRQRTEHMWDNLSAETYREMEILVRNHQVRLGAILCALTVKMLAWAIGFALPAPVSFRKKQHLSSPKSCRG